MLKGIFGEFRKGGNVGLFIKQVPKFLSLIVWLKKMRLFGFINFVKKRIKIYLLFSTV